MFDRELILQTDASDFGVGAVVSQIDSNGRENVIAYASKALSARQKMFSATEKEAYAIGLLLRFWNTAISRLPAWSTLPNCNRL